MKRGRSLSNGSPGRSDGTLMKDPSQSATEQKRTKPDPPGPGSREPTPDPCPGPSPGGGTRGAPTYLLCIPPSNPTRPPKELTKISVGPSIARVHGPMPKVGRRGINPRD